MILQLNDATLPQTDRGGLVLGILVALVVLGGFVWYVRKLSANARRVTERMQFEQLAPTSIPRGAPTEPTPPTPTALVASSVNLEKLRDSDPGFSDRQFLALARESFVLVNEAKLRGLPKIARHLLIPELESTLPATPTALPHLDVESAEISSFKIVKDQAIVGVTFNVVGLELQSQDAQPERWKEIWAFTRPASTTTAAEDVASLNPGWMVSHKGWRVCEIAGK